MARRRMIDPNMYDSQDVSKLNIQQRYLLIGLVSMADDYGKGRALPAKIRSFVFPYDDIPLSQIKDDLSVIAKYINIEFYEIDGSSFYRFKNWKKWQRVDRPQPSNIPDPKEYFDECTNNSKNDSKNDSANSSENDSGLKEFKRKEFKRKEFKRKEFKRKEEKDPATFVAGSPASLTFFDDQETQNTNKEDFILKILNIFNEEFFTSRGISYIGKQARDRKHMSGVYRQFMEVKKERGEFDLNTETVLGQLRIFFREALKIEDEWLYTKMSPAILESKFTEIRAISLSNYGKFNQPGISRGLYETINQQF